MERFLKRSILALVPAMLSALVLVAPSAAAPPAGASYEIRQRATLVSPGQIDVTIVVQCPAGSPNAVADVSVSQQQAVGANTFGFGFGPVFTCTGAKQTFSVLVNGGPFTPGDAFATGRFVTSMGHFVIDSRVISIS